MAINALEMDNASEAIGERVCVNAMNMMVRWKHYVRDDDDDDDDDDSFLFLFCLFLLIYYSFICSLVMQFPRMDQTMRVLMMMMIDHRMMQMDC